MKIKTILIALSLFAISSFSLAGGMEDFYLNKIKKLKSNSDITCFVIKSTMKTIEGNMWSAGAREAANDISRLNKERVPLSERKQIEDIKSKVISEKLSLEKKEQEFTKVGDDIDKLEYEIMNHYKGKLPVTIRKDLDDLKNFHNKNAGDLIKARNDHEKETKKYD